MQTNKTKKNTAKEILIKILNATDSLSEEMSAMRHQSAYLRGGSGYVAELKKRQEERYVKQELSRLKQQKFIEERKRGNRLELCLTEKGKKAALRYQVLKCNNLTQNYCIIIFDIPESEKNIRTFFRKFLKEADFVQLQKSVWVTQKDVGDYLIELIYLAKAKKWIHVITATKISDFSFEKLAKKS